MNCLNCGKPFIALTVIQKYCSLKCGRAYRKQHPVYYPPITFECAYCGNEVTTKGVLDRRTKFCCQDCERKYWKHQPKKTLAELDEGEDLKITT